MSGVEEGGGEGRGGEGERLEESESEIHLFDLKL